MLAEQLEEKIRGLYSLGMSYKDMAEHIYEMYDSRISSHTLQQITDCMIPKAKAWPNRSLNKVYPILWLDALQRYSIRLVATQQPQDSMQLQRHTTTLSIFVKRWRERLSSWYRPQK